MADVRITSRPPEGAVLYWSTWGVASAITVGLWIAGWHLPGLEWVIGGLVALWLRILGAAFLLVEVPAALLRPEWTYSWSVWSLHPVARWALALLHGFQASVTLHPLIGDWGVLFGVGVTVWLGGHFPGKGRI